MILPQRVLFPQAVLPLHIFEARYRAMLQDSLASHRMFCIGTTRDETIQNEKDQIYEILGVGLIRVSLAKPDGTSNLVLQGLSRARILRLIGGKPYQRAKIKPLSSFGGNNIATEALAAKVSELAKVRAKLNPAIPENALQFLIKLQDPEILSDLVTFTLLENCQEKQAVLETLDLRIRLKKVIIFLQKEIDRLNFIQGIKNGPDEEKSKLN